ncbi:MAG: hypothetical protein J6U00_11655 [Ruminococcus sp.]|uniref:hypothetical protein n=1 Tax=Ruminococcus sp. TaxID=41978 RepID=UPI001B2B80DB|nr:hypothetical protein [Ruminococcus sp.]MBO7474627.1 hypothetical protein [Ruminococcus sp.]MBP5433222.1 hypothetical protein [Ruminococcus sp.]
MKKVGLQMSILMAVTLSFCLSLLGTLSSGHFTVPGFLMSFGISTVISLIIGFLVPMKKLEDGLVRKCGIEEHSLPARLLSTLVSDLVYTPILTFSMVFMAYKQATAHGSNMPFLPSFIKSLILSLIVAYIIIFIVKPLFLKFVMKQNGISGMPADKS